MFFRKWRRKRLQRQYDDLIARRNKAQATHSRSSHITRELRMVTARLLVT